MLSKIAYAHAKSGPRSCMAMVAFCMVNVDFAIMALGLSCVPSVFWNDRGSTLESSSHMIQHSEKKYRNVGQAKKAGYC